MRKIIILVCFAFVFLTTPSRAAEEYGWRFAATTTDIFIARPFTFAATILGGALWAVALPITLPTRTGREAFDALVRQPWELTVDRELGDFAD
ncbi:MAG TPA: hypothetical protein VNT99_11705 [Methylomirabilota bacterium]|nr:hypothetical protein [Methylomirabilota bacterium]